MRFNTFSMNSRCHCFGIAPLPVDSCVLLVRASIPITSNSACSIGLGFSASWAAIPQIICMKAVALTNAMQNRFCTRVLMRPQFYCTRRGLSFPKHDTFKCNNVTDDQKCGWVHELPGTKLGPGGLRDRQGRLVFTGRRSPHHGMQSGLG